MNFQGKVVNASDGTNITNPNNTYSIVFRIYNTASPTMTTACTATASCLWQETQASVQLTNGIFQVELGSACSLTGASCNNATGGPINFASSNSLYLTMQFNGDTSGSNGGFMSPLIHITSVPFAFQADNASTLGGIAASGFIQNTTSVQSANFFVQSANSANIAGIVKGASSQSVDIFDVDANGISSPLFSVGSGGAISFTNSSNSTAALSVVNAAGSAILKIDTTTSNTNNTVANPSFESALSNWSALGTGTASQSSAQAYEGNDSLLIASGATEGGASYSTGATTFLSTNTTYSLSAFLKTDSNVPIHIDMGDEEATGTLIPCLTAQLLPQGGGWQRFTCTWTTSALTPNSSFIYFKQTSTDPAATKNIYVDDVLLQTDANAQTVYRNGSISFSGAMTASPLILQNSTNSTNALQVNNAAGSQIFNIDTTDSNLISNPGLEANAAGWSAQGTNTTYRRDTTQSYAGVASLKITQVTSTTANSGAQFSLNPIVTAASTTYTASFYGKLDGSSAAFTDVLIEYSADGTQTAGHFSDCGAGAINTATMVSGGWTRFTCQVSSATVPTTSGYLRIMSTGTTIHTYYIDGVQLEATSTPSAYGAGAISVNGIINTPVVIAAKSNSTTAFVIQNSSSGNVLSADTLNNFVTLGSGAGTAATLLVIGNKTDANDPATCTPGAIYYNSSGSADTEFRACRKNTAGTAGWYNLIAGVDIQTFTSGTTNWTKPQGVTLVYVVLCGGGGGGGGGRTGATLTARGGGTGGGGGARAEELLPAADLTSTVSVTVAAQTGQAAVSSSGSGGGTTSFGSFVKAFGGGGGFAGQTSGTDAGGAGGGIVAAGAIGAAATTLGGGAEAVNEVGQGFSGGGGNIAAVGKAAENGGSAGGGASGTGTVGFGGGDSFYGGGGGGGAGGENTSDVFSNGANGGGTGTFSFGGGGGSGTGGSTTGGSGTAGATYNTYHCGTGGGGAAGGNSATGVGGVGGDGGNGGGGGGGGAGGTTGGLGGRGAAGVAYIYSW